MTDYSYSKVAVYAELGGALRLARNSRTFVTDTVTGLPVNVTQNGFTAPYLDTDPNGIAAFTATTLGPIRLTTGATFVDVFSEEMPALYARIGDVVSEAQVAAQYLTRDQAAASYGAVVDPAASVRTMVGWHSMWIADDILMGDGDAVNSWPKSGGGGAFVQPTPALQPRLTKNKIGTRQAVTFFNSYLQNDLPATLTPPFSVYIVANSNLSVGVRVATFLTSVGGSRKLWGISTGNLPFLDDGGNLFGGVALTTKVARVASIINGAASNLRVDGVDNIGTTGTGNMASIGLGAELLAGVPAAFGFLNIGFVGIKAGVFTATELTNLDAWATTYYGLTVQPEVSQENWSWWTRPRAVAYRGKTYVPVTGPNTDNTIQIYEGASRTPSKVTVGSSGGPIDDHNDGALIIEPGKAPVLMYTRHGTVQKMMWRKGALPIEQDLGLTSLAAAVEQNVATVGWPSYCSAHVHNGNIWAYFRDAAGSDWRWSLIKSTDWATTFAAPVRIISHAKQFYMASKVRGDVLRIAGGSHPINESDPDQNVYYCEVNLLTGSITKADGTVLGNLDGTNLPIELSTLTLVATAAAGRVKWVYDVSDGPVPEIAWSSFVAANVAPTSTYHYSVLRGGVWTTRDVVAAGGTFCLPSPEPYLGGAQFPSNTSGGTIYVAREAAGTWIIERRVTTDDGTTWHSTTLAASATAKLARAWPVEARGGSTVSHEVVLNQVTRTLSFTDQESTVRPV